MKKIILLIGVFLTFGCSAKYDLIIKEDTVEENLLLSSEQSDIGAKDELYGQYLDEYPIYYDEEFLYYAPTKKKDGVTYYEKSILNSEFGYNATYKAKFDFDEYQRSRLLNNAFENYNIGYDYENDYYFIIAQDLKVFDYNNLLNNITINISLVNYEIVESNASSQVANNLTWNFTRSTTNEADRIILRYRELKNNQGVPEEPVVENPTNEIETTTEDYVIIIVAFLLFIPLLVIVILFKNKLNYRKNK